MDKINKAPEYWDDYGRKCRQIRRLPLQESAGIWIGYASYIELKNEDKELPPWESLEKYDPT